MVAIHRAQFDVHWNRSVPTLGYSIGYEPRPISIEVLMALKVDRFDRYACIEKKKARKETHYISRIFVIVSLD